MRERFNFAWWKDGLKELETIVHCYLRYTTNMPKRLLNETQFVYLFYLESSLVE